MGPAYFKKISPMSLNNSKEIDIDYLTISVAYIFKIYSFFSFRNFIETFQKHIIKAASDLRYYKSSRCNKKDDGIEKYRTS